MKPLLLIPLLLLAGCGGATPHEPMQASTSRNKTSFLMYPNVLVDPAHQALFARTQQERLSAVELRSGQIRWTGEKDWMPLAVVGDQLLAGAPVRGEPNRLQIVWIDVDKGVTERKSDAVEFPDWVSVLPARGRSFQVSSRFDGSNLIVDWDAHAFYPGGARPTSAVLDRAKREASGRIAIKPVTGEIAMLEAGPDVRESSQAFESARYWDGFGWSRTPIEVADELVILELQDNSGGQALNLVRLDPATGSRSGEAELGTGVNLRVVLCADHGCLLVADTGSGNSQIWKVVELPGARQLGAVTVQGRLLAAALTGSTLLLLEDPGNRGGHYLMRAVEIEDAREVWTVMIEAAARPAPPR